MKFSDLNKFDCLLAFQRAQSLTDINSRTNLI